MRALAAKKQTQGGVRILTPLKPLLLLLIALGGTTGCVTTATEDPVEADPLMDQLEVTFTTDTTAYRPGQVVLCRVKVSNPGPPVIVRALDHKSVDFYYGPLVADTRFKREPAYSEKEVPGEMTRLATGESMERVYVHTRFTEDPGDFTSTAIYRPMPLAPGQPGSAGITAPAVEYRVLGERNLHRDSEGILMKEDAIGLCLREAGRPPVRSDAVLVVNEAGLLDWWVSLEFQAPGESKASDGMAWFVNPYLGAIRGKAEYWEPGTKGPKKNYTINQRKGGAKSGK